jgi:hypothetical protein
MYGIFYPEDAEDRAQIIGLFYLKSTADETLERHLKRMERLKARGAELRRETEAIRAKSLPFDEAVEALSAAKAKYALDTQGEQWYSSDPDDYAVRELEVGVLCPDGLANCT